MRHGDEATTPLPIDDLGATGTTVVEGEGAAAQLVGSACTHCGALGFPHRWACTSCGGTDLRPAGLGSRGRLYTFAAVHVSATREVPYVLGYVDLDTGPRLLATIGADEDELTTDQPVVLDTTGDVWRFVPDDSEGPGKHDGPQEVHA